VETQQPKLDKQVEVQVDRLVDQDDGQHSREEIESLAQESVADLEDAPVQTYVPNLVYNDVKTRLLDDGDPPEAPAIERADRAE